MVITIAVVLASLGSDCLQLDLEGCIQTPEPSGKLKSSPPLSPGQPLVHLRGETVWTSSIQLDVSCGLATRGRDEEEAWLAGEAWLIITRCTEPATGRH